MTTLLFTSSRFAEHEVPEGHAERSERMAAVDRALGSGDLAGLERREAPRAGRDALLRGHSEAYVSRIEAAAPQDGIVQLDPDTFMGAHSLEAALRGAGGALAATDAVLSGEAERAFVASRPPGHHAEREAAMGFCLFSNAALAALHAREAHGLRRVAVLDFDVHHGNGTQDVLWDEPGMFYASSHEWPLYPGTGEPSERGAAGTVRNATLAAGEGGAAFRRAWGEDLLPQIAAFGPELLIVSAGFDAHAADPLANLQLVEDDFEWITAEIRALADSQCGGRIVSLLEGGYDLGALERSVACHVKRLAR
ncbi:histone deacetylase family protein [Parvularcula oceani]|uniref:histone deacetylase family protein n=1 Tax=Parvularcula oceani TaxID=1247963 RepID=UPI0004E1D02E|nr:histone deacetylase family protein [Parvularcula oceani]